jgi:hypothetical protein
LVGLLGGALFSRSWIARKHLLPGASLVKRLEGALVRLSCCALLCASSFLFSGGDSVHSCKGMRVFW